MSPRQEIKRKFTEIMLNGINIHRHAQNDFILDKTPEDFNKLFDDYRNWRIDISKFLHDTNQDYLDSYELYLGDSVPSFKSAIYDKPSSPAGKELISAIRNETASRIKAFKEVGDRLFKGKDAKIKLEDPDLIKIKAKNNIFIFNKITGDSILNKTKANFPAGQQKFKVLSVILSQKEYQADYKILCEALGWIYSKSKWPDIHMIVKEIKEGLEILPEKTAKNQDIFENIEGIGYRIILK